MVGDFSGAAHFLSILGLDDGQMSIEPLSTAQPPATPAAHEKRGGKRAWWRFWWRGAVKRGNLATAPDAG